MKAHTPEFYTDAAGEHRWRIWAPNAKIIGASPEGFVRRRGAVDNLKLLEIALRSISTNVEFYRDADHDWRWRVWGGNSEIVGASSEGYRDRSDAEVNVEQLRRLLAHWTSLGHPE